MCGIVAAVGLPGALGVVLNGLNDLEYRGYDSAGAAWPEKGAIRVVRAAGRVSDLRARLDSSQGRDAEAAMGHTRWATHGPPLERNAHPHLSSDGRVAVAHNGIIDNYRVHKDALRERGVAFSSDTDTEVIANLAAERYRGDLTAAVEEILPLLDGAYALVFMAADQPGLLVAARRGGPLAIGLGTGFNLAASDAVPIIPHTRRVVFLEEGQTAAITAGHCEIREAGKSVSFSATEITWSVEAARKSGYPHYMLKEINEQPRVLEEMFRNRLRFPASPDAAPEFGLDGMENLSDAYLQGVSRIVLLAQGTAYHACMVGRNLLERTTRIPAYPEYATDFRYRDPILDPSVLVIAVTQSGETADTLNAVRLARKNGCRVLTVANAVGSSIPRESDSVFHLNCGPEKSVASTKAFTAMIAGLYFLALRIGQVRGAIDQGELIRRAGDLLGIGARLNSVLACDGHIRAIAERYRDARNFLFLGRGTGWPLAMEGALKLKEVSYIHAEGYDAAEMKHGPIALVDKDMPVLFIALSGRRYDKIVGNIEEVRARGGRVIAIASRGDQSIGRLADDVIHIRDDSGIMNSICCAVPLQLLAYHIAVARGHDPDYPRGLAKSVTVE